MLSAAAPTATVLQRDGHLGGTVRRIDLANVAQRGRGPRPRNFEPPTGHIVDNVGDQEEEAN